MSKRGTTEVPVQPQVILKTSKKLKLSFLHMMFPSFKLSIKYLISLAVCIRFPLELRKKIQN